MKSIATLVFLVALLALLSPLVARPGARVAAQDSPAAPAGTPVTTEAGGEPGVTTEPSATTEPSPTPDPTAPPEPVPSATPEPSPTPDPAVAEAPSQVVGATPAEALGTPPVAAAEQPSLTLTVAGEAVSFGRVSATGERDPAITGLSSQADERGASYVLAGAVAVTVAAGVPWTGACRAGEQSGTAPTVTVAGGRLEWRLAGTAAWTPFVPGVADDACFPNPALGTETFVYDLRLRIEATDPAGTFQTVLVLEAVP